MDKNFTQVVYEAGNMVSEMSMWIQHNTEEGESTTEWCEVETVQHTV